MFPEVACVHTGSLCFILPIRMLLPFFPLALHLLQLLKDKGQPDYYLTSLFSFCFLLRWDSLHFQRIQVGISLKIQGAFLPFYSTVFFLCNLRVNTLLCLRVPTRTQRVL